MRRRSSGGGKDGYFGASFESRLNLYEVGEATGREADELGGNSLPKARESFSDTIIGALGALGAASGGADGDDAEGGVRGVEGGEGRAERRPSISSSASEDDELGGLFLRSNKREPLLGDVQPV